MIRVLSRDVPTTMSHCCTLCANCVHRHNVHIIVLSVWYTFLYMTFSMHQTPTFRCCIHATHFIFGHASIVLVHIRLPRVQPTLWSTPLSYNVWLYASTYPTYCFHPVVPRAVRHTRRRCIRMSRHSVTVRPPPIVLCPSHVTKHTRLLSRQTHCATVSLLH